MSVSTAEVRTANASSNLKKLCRHFSHKVETQFDDSRGEIRFPFGGVGVLTAEDGILRLEARADSEEHLARTEKVLTDHLLRFSHRETLEVQWRRSDQP